MWPQTPPETWNQLKKERHLVLAAYLVHVTLHLLDKCVSFLLERNADLSIQIAERPQHVHWSSSNKSSVKCSLHSLPLHRWQTITKTLITLCVLCAIDSALHHWIVKIRLLEFMIIALMYICMSLMGSCCADDPQLISQRYSVTSSRCYMVWHLHFFH